MLNRKDACVFFFAFKNECTSKKVIFKPNSPISEIKWVRNFDIASVKKTDMNASA